MENTGASSYNRVLEYSPHLKLNKAQYRIFYDGDMEILFYDAKSPFEPIEAWIRERLG